MNNPLYSLHPDIRNSCYFAQVFPNGSPKDFSSIEATTTIGAGVSWGRRDGQFHIVPDLVATSDLQYAYNARHNLTGNDWTFFASIVPPIVDPDSHVFARQVDGADRTHWFYQAGSLRLYTGSITRTLNLSLVGKNTVTTRGVDGGVPQSYLDGVLEGSHSGTISWPNVTTGSLETQYSNVAGSPGLNIRSMLLFDRRLTESEIADLHTWSQSLSSPSLLWNGYDQPSRVPGLEPSCVGAWDLGDLKAGVLPDRSGNGYNGTVSGFVQKVKTEVGEAGRFTGQTSDFISFAPIDVGTNSSTIVCIFRVDSLSEINALVCGDTNYSKYIEVLTDGSVELETDTNNDKAASSAGVIVAGKLHHLTITCSSQTVSIYVDGVDVSSDTSVTNASMTFENIGILGVNEGFNGEVKSIRFFNEVWTEDQIAADYKKFAQIPTFISQESTSLVSLANETSGNLSNTPWKITSGTWKVVDDSEVEGGRAIECQAAGIIYIESTRAYGTWEYDFYPHSSSPDFGFMCSANDKLANAAGQSGYFYCTNGTRLMTKESNVSNNAYTDTGYITYDTWYRLRITRRYDNVTTFYVKGGEYTEWTKPVVVFGSNPWTDSTVTTSKYIVFGSTVSGDKIANYRHYQGVLALTA